jgi:hypothetical protein
LTVKQILRWADEHHRRTGQWPQGESGVIGQAAPQTWRQIDRALREGLRGLSPGSSLARLLAEKRGVRNLQGLPPLKEEEILAWADEHHRRTGQWPNMRSGPIAGSPDQVWHTVDTALRDGVRGLPGGSSLARLLAARRGVRNRLATVRFTEAQVLAWADAYHRREGEWPHSASGPIPESPGDTWRAVDNALRQGWRGLKGGTSLARLLARKRGVRNRGALPRLNEKQILAWADAYRERTGRWPTGSSGPIDEAPGETWRAVHLALAHGLRGLKSGLSLAQLLHKYRGKPPGKR